jgi:hypothetical protein
VAEPIFGVDSEHAFEIAQDATEGVEAAVVGTNYSLPRTQCEVARVHAANRDLNGRQGGSSSTPSKPLHSLLCPVSRAKPGLFSLARVEAQSPVSRRGGLHLGRERL